LPDAALVLGQVEQASPVAGDHEKVEAPFALNKTESFEHTLELAVTAVTGNTAATAIVTLSVLLQPLAEVPVT